MLVPMLEEEGLLELHAASRKRDGWFAEFKHTVLLLEHSMAMVNKAIPRTTGDDRVWHTFGGLWVQRYIVLQCLS